MQRKIKFIVTVFLRSGETVPIGCYDLPEVAYVATDFALEYPGRKINITFAHGGQI